MNLTLSLYLSITFLTFMVMWVRCLSFCLRLNAEGPSLFSVVLMGQRTAGSTWMNPSGTFLVAACWCTNSTIVKGI